jgi:integrase
MNYIAERAQLRQSQLVRVIEEVCQYVDWTLHDLRRTFATRLAELGVAPHVIERLLNHVTGTVPA